MLQRLLGTKIGMTQLFDEQRNVIPVTIIDVGGWFVTQVKTEETDGYNALQLSLPRKRYRNQPFSPEWLKAKKKFFVHTKEVHFADAANYTLGKEIDLKECGIAPDELIHVAGTSIGRGFQGVMKRWNFGGGPGGHGSTFHRKPGSIGNICSQGKVVKGKKLPGQYGNKRRTIKNLKVIKVDAEKKCLYVTGAVPGKKNTLLYIRKQGS